MTTFAPNPDPHEKIALLFLTQKDLNQSTLWQKALEGKDDRYTVYVHSKYPMDDEFFKKYRISNIVPTTWANHVKAWQVLLEEAIKDKANVKFVFLSESCVPLYSLDKIYNELQSDKRSRMGYGRKWWNDYRRTLVEIPEKHHFGNNERVILNRNHAEMIVADKTIIEIAAKHPVDIESYFATFFSINDQLNDDYFINFQTTYENWVGHSPYEFLDVNAFSLNLFNQAKESRCFFARKFSNRFPTHLLMELIGKK